MTFNRLMAVVVAGLSLAAACASKPSGIVVEISTDYKVPEEIDRLSVKIWNESGILAQDLTFPLTGKDAAQLPARLGLEPQGSSLGSVTVEASVSKGSDTALVVRRAIANFEKGRVLLLPVPLARICAGVMCPAGQTCAEGKCVDASAGARLRDYAGDQSGPERLRMPPAVGIEPGGMGGRTGVVIGQGGAIGGSGTGGSGGSGGTGIMGTGGTAGVIDGGSGGATMPRMDAPIVVPPADGAPLFANGRPCTSNSHCANGFCANFVCCGSSCGNPCESCSMAATGRPDGECAPVRAGGSSNGTCATQLPTTCGTDGTCDGARACRRFAAGTTCRSPACAQNIFTNSAVCDGLGKCLVATETNCGAFLCNATGCRNSCAGDADCVSPQKCIGGACGGKRANGAACAGNAECSSNFCVDGVCCGSVCSGLCESCAMVDTGQPSGTCRPVRADANPGNECVADAVNPCGTQAACNGAGACKKAASSTVCAPADCQASSFKAARTCDGMGACNAATTSDCGTFQCNSSGCLTTCTGDSQCGSTAYCASGTCYAKKNQGLGCGRDQECGLGICRDGFCCDVACSGMCEACANSRTGRSNGTCAAVTAGTDLDGECADEAMTAPCGLDGTCDGNRACRRYASGTVCAASSCPANTSTFTPARTCDGVGTCRTSTATTCTGGLTCNGTTQMCRGACTGASDCSASTYCLSGSCVAKKANGSSATSTAECSSGIIADGVCCQNACTTPCRTCANTAGTCTTLVTSADDNNCNTMSTCNAGGACGLKINSSCSTAGQCASGNCPDGLCCPVACTEQCRRCDSNGCSAIRYATDTAGTVCNGNFWCDGSSACSPAIVVNRTANGPLVHLSSFSFGSLSCCDASELVSAVDFFVSRPPGTSATTLTFSFSGSHASYFSIGGSQCTGTSNPGTNCVIDVRMTTPPYTPGSFNMAATLTVSDSAGNSVSIDLSGQTNPL